MIALRLRLLALSSLAACTSGADSTPHGRTEDQATALPDAGNKPSTGKDSVKDGGSTPVIDAGGPEEVMAAGLPCEVSAILSEHCQTCHGAPTNFGAPFSLLTRTDLMSPVADQAGKTRLEVALARVQDDKSPMPPAPAARLTKAELATLQSYLDAGLPASQASCSSPRSDAGATTVGPGAAIPKPDDCENSYALTAHGTEPNSKFTMSSSPALEGNQYQCFFFDPPYGDDQTMYWFDSILDNTANLHHWILYGTDDKTHENGTTAGCNAAEPGSYFIAGWAPGGTNGAAAGDVALQLPSGPKAGLILEVHYYNNTGKAQTDASGVRFCTGKKEGREHLAAVHTLGSEGICIQPGKQQDVTGQCTPRTDMGDVHITGIWPHMHKIARHMKVTINRVDGTKQVIHDAPFDFNAQIFYPLEGDVVVHPGDTVSTTCSYENEGTTAVHYGERTQDEMCYAFTVGWPAGGLANVPTYKSPDQVLGNRCAEDWSILQSCNGLADAPKNVSHPK
jgi:mono/diheme cytochrome c family protein